MFESIIVGFVYREDARKRRNPIQQINTKAVSKETAFVFIYDVQLNGTM